MYILAILTFVCLSNQTEIDAGHADSNILIYSQNYEYKFDKESLKNKINTLIDFGDFEEAQKLLADENEKS